ncbi:MAG TPA: heavy metal translocating P-type ATPase, partial [Pirellulales bacterium]
MNLLMVLAAAGAIAIADYFEAATAMFLFAISLWLERISLQRAQRATSSLLTLAPNIAHRMIDSETAAAQIVDVGIADLAVGQQLLVRPGERIPADAVVKSGQSSVNQAPITGESFPVEKQPGDRVFAGTLNGEGSLVLTITQPPEDSTLARIARLIEEARASRSRMERFIDAFARRYTPTVIALALGVMFVPSLLGYFGVGWAAAVGTHQWIHRGLVLLVIACPCALVISTPVTIVSGLYQAARFGILVKGAEFLEKSATLRAIALDKTGTLTTGSMHLVEIQAFNGRSSIEVLELAAALEQHSEHPVAQAIRAAAIQQSAASHNISTIQALRGFGVRGELNGNTYFLGNARLFETLEFRFSPEDFQRLRVAGDAPLRAADESNSNGTAVTRVWLGQSTELIGEIRIADPPRAEVAQAIVELRRLG